MFSVTNGYQLATFAAFLNIDSDTTQGLECSHLCDNAVCLNDQHVTMESHSANHHRVDCQKLCIQDCRCVKKCIHQVNGQVVPCKVHPEGECSSVVEAKNRESDQAKREQIQSVAGELSGAKLDQVIELLKSIQ